MTEKIASIDIGSQTIRLLIASIDNDGTLRPLYRDRSIVRLGEGMQTAQELQPEAMDRAVACIGSFVEAARSHGAGRILPVCTACVRNAGNASQFLNRVRREAGVLPRVVSGEEEARLSLQGVASVLAHGSGPLVIIDIGGGSTEIVYLKNSALRGVESIGLGVIGLSEQHLHHDPPHRDDIAALTAAVSALVNDSSLLHAARRDRARLAGTAGTVTTLAAMDLRMRHYDPEKINGYWLALQTVQSFFETMIALPLKQRKDLPGLEPGRALVIIPGAAAVLCVMRLLGADSMLVSDAGLLEGIVLDALAAPSGSQTFS